MSQNIKRQYYCRIAKLWTTEIIQSHVISGSRIGQSGYVQKDHQCLSEETCAYAMTDVCPYVNTIDDCLLGTVFCESMAHSCNA